MLGQAVQADSSPVKTPQESTHFADVRLNIIFVNVDNVWFLRKVSFIIIIYIYIYLSNFFSGLTGLLPYNKGITVICNVFTGSTLALRASGKG